MSSLRPNLLCFRDRPRSGVERAWLTFPLAALTLIPVRAAAAEAGGPPEQVELQFATSTGCPSQTVFVNELGARIRRPIEWVSSNPITLIVVTLQQADEHATGTLEVTRRSTPPTHREFIASTCAEVGSALALVTALTLDPNARTEALPLRAETPSEPAPTPTTVAPASLAPSAASTTAAASSFPASERAAPPAPAPAPSTGTFAWLGPVAGVSGGYAPEPLVTFGLSLGAQTRTSSGLSPSLQLTPLWGKTGATGPAASGGSFGWAMARLEACPTLFQVARSLALVPCAAGEVGRLSARGSASNIVPISAERWWVAAGITAALHLRQGPWFARLGAYALFPAIRDKFVFQDPDQDIHRPSALVSGASLGLGFEFGR
jgi:hypothetical protein